MLDTVETRFPKITEEGLDDLRKRIGVSIGVTAEPWCYEATRDNKTGRSHAKFNGTGGMLTHIGFMPGRPRHSPKRTVSASPELGPFLCPPKPRLGAKALRPMAA